MDFVVGLPNHDPIFVVVECFFKMVHFIACKHTMDVVHVAYLYFRVVYHLQGLSTSIVFYHYTRFLSYSWLNLWKIVNTQFNFSSAFHLQTMVKLMF